MTKHHETHDDASGTPSNPEESVSKLDKKVCKQQHVVGSRRPRQVCQSERERRELAEQSQRNMMDRGACREGSSVTCSGG